MIWFGKYNLCLLKFKKFVLCRGEFLTLNSEYKIRDRAERHCILTTALVILLTKVVVKKQCLSARSKSEYDLFLYIRYL